MTAPLLAILLLATPASQPASQPAVPPPDNTMGKQAKVHRGAPFKLAEQISMDDLAKQAKALKGKTVKVVGQIDKVCKKKGCWMVVRGADKKARARIVFKDYSFFAPLDSAGAACTVEGEVELKSLEEDMRKHLAKDEGVPLDQVPKHEVRIIATALEVRRGGS